MNFGVESAKYGFDFIMKLSIVNVLFLMVWLILGIFSSSTMAAPFIPGSAAYIVEKLQTKPNDPVAQEFNQLRSQLLRQPDNMPLATHLARRYIEKSRAEADPRYLGYAQAALSHWWKMEKPPSQVLVLRATIYQSNHNFQDALSDLSLALKREPKNAQALLTRSSIFRVQGDYHRANQDCLKLKGLVEEVVTASCISGVVSHNGQLLKSYNFLLDVLKNKQEVKASPSEIVWVLTDLAEMAARAGLLQAAEYHFKEALAQNITDSYLLGSYSDFLLDQKRPEEVVSLLKEKIRADGLLLRFAIAKKQLGSEDLSIHVSALSSRFEASQRRGDIVHRREESRFVLEFMKDPEKALKISLANWTVQKEPWDLRIVLESAIAANRYSDSRPVLDWLSENSLEDVRIEQYIKKLNIGKKRCCG